MTVSQRNLEYAEFCKDITRRCKDALPSFLETLAPNITLTADFGACEDSYETRRAKNDVLFAKKYIGDHYEPPTKIDEIKVAPASFQHSHRLFKEWIFEMEKAVNGRTFYQLPPEKRIQGVSFVESLHKNIHFHVILKVPTERIVKFCNKAPSIWKQTVKRGSVKSSFTRPKQLGYSVKETYKIENYELYFFIEDFWRKTETSGLNRCDGVNKH